MIGVCAAVLAGLCGCSSAGAYGRELEETVLVQVIGVDGGEDGVVLTAAGTDGEGECVMVETAGDGLAEAFAALPAAGEKYCSLTNVTRILVGDGVELWAVLDYVLNDRDMSYNATVWAVSGFAGAVMEETEDGGMARFSVLDQSGAEEVTVKAALAALLDSGETALPALAVRDGVLEVVGTVYHSGAPAEGGQQGGDA